MTRIAVLGLGAMGSRMAARLIDAGFQVTVWNRTPARADTLVERGATVAGSPGEAADGADVVLSMVRDDAASRRVWLDDGALSALKPGAVGLECSTLSVPFVRELARAFDEADRAFLDAPLAGSRPQAEAGQLIFLAGGHADTVDRVRPVLDPLAAAVHHAGHHGAGATVKLMVNALFGAQLGLMAELTGFAEKSGVDPTSAIEIIGATPVCSPAARVGAQAMLAGAWAPAFPIDLVAKDFALLERSAADASASVPLSDCAGMVYTGGVERGFGGDNITGIVQLYR